jgi:hypothetical protein
MVIPLCDPLMRQRMIVLLCIFVFTPVSLGWADSWNVELAGKTPGVVYDVFVLDNYVYMCAGSMLIILNISDPSNPAEIGRAYVPDIARGVHVSGGYAYVADGESGSCCPEVQWKFNES